MNHRPWINFKELRTQLNFAEVLRHYKVEVTTKGEQHKGPCPLPGHTSSRAAPSFSANLKRNIFQCFGCGAKGNVLEFAALMEIVDPKNGDALRTVAVKLQERFFPGSASTRTQAPAVQLSGTLPAPASPTATAPVVPDGPATTPAATTKALPILVNEPIDFELKGLDRGHEFFAMHKLSIETAQYFGLGYCSRGSLSGRIAIPLHDAEGRLIGYAGRALDGASVDDENPLYRFPTRREREGRVLEFDQTAFLYNCHRITAPCDDIIVVENFTSVWWLQQCGFPRVVGLMGNNCSEAQAQLVVSLVGPAGKVWIWPAGNKASWSMAELLIWKLAAQCFVRWVELSEGQKPTDLSADQLKERFTS